MLIHVRDMLKFTKVTKVNKLDSSWGVTLATSGYMFTFTKVTESYKLYQFVMSTLGHVPLYV